MKKDNPLLIAAGLGFGDEGKGSIVDFLTHKYNIHTVIRFNGGSQAAHNVVTPEGLSHTFAQFGSGTLIKDVRTYLSPQMLVDPISLLQEELVLKQKGILDAMKRLTIDSKCTIITPFHKMIGQMQEILRGKNKFSTTGKGVGQAVLNRINNPESAITFQDCFSEKTLQHKLEEHILIAQSQALELLDSTESKEAEDLYKYFITSYSSRKLFNIYRGFVRSYSGCIDRKGNTIQKLLKSGKPLLFEGAQGILLDPEFGFSPYITKTKTDFHHAEKLIPTNSNKPEIQRIGILRAYAHRHGNGPLPTENKALRKKIQEEHNTTNNWQGDFRIGWFDLLTARYAIEVSGRIDSLALTCLDQLSGLSTIKVCISYEYKGTPANDLKHFFYLDKKNTITGIKKLINPREEERKKQTQYLQHCKPYQYLEFKGWKEKLPVILSLSDLPKNAKNYIDFLESREGLNHKISILSFGKTREDKFMV